MPINIITKLKNKKISTSGSEKHYFWEICHENKFLSKHNLEINYLKKSNGNGPKVLDS